MTTEDRMNELAKAVDTALRTVADSVAKHIIQRSGFEQDDKCYSMDLRRVEQDIIDVCRTAISEATADRDELHAAESSSAAGAASTLLKSLGWASGGLGSAATEVAGQLAALREENERLKAERDNLKANADNTIADYKNGYLRERERAEKAEAKCKLLATMHSRLQSACDQFEQNSADAAELFEAKLAAEKRAEKAEADRAIEADRSEQLRLQLLKTEAERDRLQKATVWSGARELRLAAEADASRLREVLRSVEWNGHDRWTYAACPSCRNPTYSGNIHKPGCRLAAALRPEQPPTEQELMAQAKAFPLPAERIRELAKTNKPPAEYFADGPDDEKPFVSQPPQPSEPKATPAHLPATCRKCGNGVVVCRCGPNAIWQDPPAPPTVKPPTFCCQAARKMWELTSPDARELSPFIGTCAVCGGPEPYTYHVPESIWRTILPEKLWGEIVCAKCFHEAATPPTVKPPLPARLEADKSMTDAGKPAYIVWSGFRDWNVCDSLTKALEAKSRTGGMIYEPMGMTTAVKVATEVTPVPPDPNRGRVVLLTIFPFDDWVRLEPERKDKYNAAYDACIASVGYPELEPALRKLATLYREQARRRDPADLAKRKE